jgi:hypothetical protein
VAPLMEQIHYPFDGYTVGILSHHAWAAIRVHLIDTSIPDVTTQIYCHKVT